MKKRVSMGNMVRENEHKNDPETEKENIPETDENEEVI